MHEIEQIHVEIIPRSKEKKNAFCFKIYNLVHFVGEDNIGLQYYGSQYPSRTELHK